MRFSPDGRVDLSLSLPTHVKGRNGIYLSATDQIIARANDNLQFLQADDGNRQTLEWNTLCEQCGVSQSPSRRTLVLHVNKADPSLMILRFSPQPALRPCGKSGRFIESHHEDKIQNYTGYITDEFAYFDNWKPESGHYTYRWPLCDYEHRVEMPLHVVAIRAVLNDDTFVVYPYSKRRNDEEMEVISSDGHVKFHPTMQAHESAAHSIWTPIKISEHGNLIAVDLLTIRGRNQALDLSGHVTARRIAVYDIEAGTQIASIPVSPRPRYHFEFDLSPDGHRLAILEDDKVRVVDIKGTEKAK
jgi:hypothetical protein